MNDPKRSKVYLGDAVYAEPLPGDPGGIKLTTSNGILDTNTIILEDQVLDALLLWLELPK